MADDPITTTTEFWIPGVFSIEKIWNHCVAVLDNTNNTINLYINGVLNQTFTKT